MDKNYYYLIIIQNNLTIIIMRDVWDWPRLQAGERDLQWS
jgi:hypothetical protein